MGSLHVPLEIVVLSSAAPTRAEHHFLDGPAAVFTLYRVIAAIATLQLPEMLAISTSTAVLDRRAVFSMGDIACADLPPHCAPLRRLFATLECLE